MNDPTEYASALTGSAAQTPPASGRRIVFWSLLKRAFDRQTLVVCFGAAFVASLVGPFGTYMGAGILANFALWAVLIYCVTICVYFSLASVAMVLGRANGMAFNVLLVLMGSLLGGTMIELVLTNALDHTSPDRPAWIWLVGYVGAIMIAILFTRLSVPVFNTSFHGDISQVERFISSDTGNIAPDLQPEEAQAEETPPLTVRVRLANRLGLPQGAEILKVSADGHFVEVKTCSKDYRTRLRFSDALTEIEGLDGIVTHRSHWVARDAILGWMPDGVKPVIVLRDHTLVPISRTYRADVEAQAFKALTQDDLKDVAPI